MGKYKFVIVETGIDKHDIFEGRKLLSQGLDFAEALAFVRPMLNDLDKVQFEFADGYTYDATRRVRSRH